MKLLLCKKCQDIVKLQENLRHCKCRSSEGHYEYDGVRAVIFGKHAVLIGLNNESLRDAVLNQPDEGSGKHFESFIIPKNCPVIEHQLKGD